jgi:tetratricopeptide (TPR) repeat protein
MSRMMADVPCLPPLSGEVARERDNLADFPVLRLRDGRLHADLPTRAELDDLAYFMVAVSDAGEEIGMQKERPLEKKPVATARPDELFGNLVSAKAGGNVVDIERAARIYVEELGFPDSMRRDVSVAGAPRYGMALRELAQSWEALGRFHEAAGLWRRQLIVDVTTSARAWEDQVKAVIRDEEIDGRCDVAVAERLLDVGGELYGTGRLSDAKFDVARLLRGALLTINRDAGEAAVQNAIAGWPDTSRLFAQIRLRDKGVEDWERRLQAFRGLADVVREPAIPLLLRAAADSLPPGRQRAISAIGDLALRPAFDPCRSPVALPSRGGSAWTRPLRPLGFVCDSHQSDGIRRRLVAQISAFARDASPGTREAVAVALGKIGMPAARPMLRQMLGDGVLHGAARTALDNIDELERNWRTAK